MKAQKEQKNFMPGTEYMEELERSNQKNNRSEYPCLYDDDDYIEEEEEEYK